MAFGLAVAPLLAYTHTVVYTGTTYYYSAGVYYEKAPTGYVIVEPPIGIVVEAPPVKCEVVKVEPKTYCYSRGSFYLFNESAQTYVIVEAPEGVAVTAIPNEGHIIVKKNDVKYYTQATCKCVIQSSANNPR